MSPDRGYSHNDKEKKVAMALLACSRSYSLVHTNIIALFSGFPIRISLLCFLASPYEYLRSVFVLARTWLFDGMTMRSNVQRKLDTFEGQQVGLPVKRCNKRMCELVFRGSISEEQNIEGSWRFCFL